MNDVFIEQLTSLTRCESKLREELEVKVFRLVGAFFLELGETLAEIDEKKTIQEHPSHFCRLLQGDFGSGGPQRLSLYRVCRSSKKPSA